MKAFVCNDFSLSMLDREIWNDNHKVQRTPRTLNDPVDFLRQQEEIGAKVVSTVGHADEATLFSAILGRDIKPNWISFKQDMGDVLLIGQYIGPPCPKGQRVCHKTLGLSGGG